MIKIDLKPISLNEAYRGRRFATKELEVFKRYVRFSLGELKIPEGKLFVKYVFGVSSKNCDVDNQIKAFQDCLAENYGFNDKIIYKIEAEKKDVKMGKEYIKFDIKKF